MKNILISGCIVYPIWKSCFNNLGYTDLKEVQFVELNSEAYSQLAFNAKYKYNNLSFGFNLDPILSSNGELLENDWDDAVDFFDRFYLDFYRANLHKKNDTKIRICFSKLK